MSRVVVQRPARLHPPRVPAGEITLDPPPTLTKDESGAANWVQYLLPALGSMGSLLFVVTNPKPLFIVGGVLFAAVSRVGGGAAGWRRTSPRGVAGPADLSRPASATSTTWPGSGREPGGPPGSSTKPRGGLTPTLKRCGR